MSKKFFFISVLVFGVSTKLFAYYDFDKKLEQAYSSILELQFTEAEHLIHQEKIEKPGNDLGLLYLNYIDFLKSFISEEKSEFENLKMNSSIHLDELNNDKNNFSSPFHLFAQAEILIQQALVRIKFNDNIIAAAEIRKAYKLIHKNEILYPTFILNKKISGLLNVIVGSVPDKYKWIIKYAGLEGNINDGLIELQDLYKNIESTTFKSYGPEILFYLGNFISVFSMPVKSDLILKQMQPIINSSPLIAFAYSNIMMKEGRNEEALNTLNSAILANTSFSFTYLYFKRGMTRLRKLDLTAEQDFEYFINHYQGQNNIKSAYQKLAWISLIKGDSAKYFSNLNICKEKGIAIIDDDKIASDESKRGEVINTYLLRSRLYFDGGYYKNALSEIIEKNIKDFPRYRDQLEVTYRLGRIMQMMGQIEKAITYYEMTIKNGESSTYYYAANSALMLGLIYEEKKQKDKAIEYFQKCLSVKNEEYKTSLDQKALAGLERIKSLK